MADKAEAMALAWVDSHCVYTLGYYDDRGSPEWTFEAWDYVDIEWACCSPNTTRVLRANLPAWVEEGNFGTCKHTAQGDFL